MRLSSQAAWRDYLEENFLARRRLVSMMMAGVVGCYPRRLPDAYLRLDGIALADSAISGAVIVEALYTPYVPRSLQSSLLFSTEACTY